MFHIYLEDVFTTSAPIVKEVIVANASVDIVVCETTKVIFNYTHSQD